MTLVVLSFRSKNSLFYFRKSKIFSANTWLIFLSKEENVTTERRMIKFKI